MSWSLFAISAPLIWGVANVIDKYIRMRFIKNDVTLTWFGGLLRLAPIVVMTAYIGIEVPSISAFFGMLSAGALWVIPFILYYKAMAAEEASRVALLITIAPLFTLIFGAIIIGERLSEVQSVAFILMLCGGVLASLKSASGRLRLSKAAVLITVASASWALSDVLFKNFAPYFTRGFFSAMNVDLMGGVLFAILLTPFSFGGHKLWKPLKDVPRTGWLLFVISNIIGTTGSILFAYALTLHKVSLTAVMLGIQPLVVFLATLVLSRYISSIERESISTRDLVLKASSFACFLAGLSLL